MDGWVRFSLAAALLVAAAGCAPDRRELSLEIEALQDAPPHALRDVRRAVARDPAALRRVCTTLAPRLGLVIVRSEGQWQRLAEIAPGLGKCPDLTTGPAVGLVGWTGTPVDPGPWPVELHWAQIVSGAALVRGHVVSGTYLLTDEAFIVTGVAPGVRAVRAVEVDGTTYQPAGDWESLPEANPPAVAAEPLVHP